MKEIELAGFSKYPYHLKNVVNHLIFKLVLLLEIMLDKNTLHTVM